MIVDDRDDLFPEFLQARKVERVQNSQPFPQDPVADLRDHPVREVVRIGSGDGAVPQKITVRVEVNRIDRHFFEQFGQFFFIVGLLAQQFLQLAAADECERRVRRSRASLLAFLLRHESPSRPR
ncbi:MAG: hypothetical protein KatS3mg082_0457 [Nitrospiraceae bacterium]|nr:MAG: hypothetical protein KatS3mg082_0457 [Nitrospiraceae bacterium]